jgi:hypothetical protein
MEQEGEGDFSGIFFPCVPLQTPETVVLVPQLPVGPGVDSALIRGIRAWSYPVGPGRGPTRVAAAELESRRIFHALPFSCLPVPLCA